MSVPVIGSNEEGHNELGIHHKRDYWFWADCLSDICAAETREVLRP